MNETQVTLVLGYDLFQPVVQLRREKLKHGLNLAEVVLSNRSEKGKLKEMSQDRP